MAAQLGPARLLGPLGARNAPVSSVASRDRSGQLDNQFGPPPPPQLRPPSPQLGPPPPQLGIHLVPPHPARCSELGASSAGGGRHGLAVSDGGQRWRRERRVLLKDDRQPVVLANTPAPLRLATQRTGDVTPSNRRHRFVWQHREQVTSPLATAGTASSGNTENR